MFTRMDQSTQEEWQHISEEHMPHIFDMPKRIISMLKQAESQNFKITGIAGDILNLPLEEKFDVILFDMVLHGFEESQQAELLQKYVKNLNPDGLLCIVFPDDIDTGHFIKMLNTKSQKWIMKDEIVIKDIPQVGEEVIDFTFVMQCIQSG